MLDGTRVVAPAVETPVGVCVLASNSVSVDGAVEGACVVNSAAELEGARVPAPVDSISVGA